MNIIVTVKPVPEIIKFNKETKRIERKGVKTILNPLDLAAAEEGRKLKIKTNGSLIAVSMAPPDKADVLKSLFKFGFDRIILLSDSIFGGADTIATAYVLSMGIKKFAGNFDVVLQGDYSLDGSTGQLGGELAAMLNVPYLSHVIEINENLVKRTAESGIEEFSIKFPAVLSVEQRVNNGVVTDLFALFESEGKRVEIYSNKDLMADPLLCGLNGSKTAVLSLSQNEINLSTRIIKDNVGKEILKLLTKVGVL